MNIKTLLIAGMTALSFTAPIMAHADPDDWRGDRGYREHDGWRGEHDGWQGEHEGSRGDGWRGNGWRDRDGWRAGWVAPWRWGYERRCWVENRGFYEPDGDYVVRAIRVCR